MYDSMYRCGEIFACIAVCTGVGKHLYVWHMYRCGETLVCMAICTGVGKYLYVWQYA